MPSKPAASIWSSRPNTTKDSRCTIQRSATSTRGQCSCRDLVQEIVEACRAEGLKVGFYHSLIDWHHDQFAYAESSSIPHPLRGKPYPNGERNQKEYIKYLHKQVEELVSNYGPVDILWWDYSVGDFEGEKAWDAFRLIDLVKQHQPDVIMNNRLFRRSEAGLNGVSKGEGKAFLDPRYGDFMTPSSTFPTGDARRQLGNLDDDEHDVGLQQVRSQLEVDTHSHRNID